MRLNKSRPKNLRGSLEGRRGEKRERCHRIVFNMHRNVGRLRCGLIVGGPLTGVPNVTCRIKEIDMSTVTIFLMSMSILKWYYHVECKEWLMSCR